MTNAIRLVLALVIVGGCESPPGEAPPVTGSPSVVGSWRLESWTVADGASACAPEEGRPSGQIIYAGDGQMSAQLGCSDTSLDDLAGASAEEAMARMIRRHFSYYGTYTIDHDAGTVTHRVLGSVAPAWVGTDRVRSFAFETPDRLVLSTTESDNRLVWIREDFTGTSDFPHESASGRTTGSLAPAGPPLAPPARVGAGDACIVDLRQAYRFSGTLTGSAVIDYRIFVDGECGAPAGTFDEHWIAHGTLDGTLAGDSILAGFSYLATVQEGGTVVGRIMFGDDIDMELAVTGSLEDDSLTYLARAR